jgi:hypothetical protein
MIAWKHQGICSGEKQKRKFLKVVCVISLIGKIANQDSISPNRNRINPDGSPMA